MGRKAGKRRHSPASATGIAGSSLSLQDSSRAPASKVAPLPDGFLENELEQHKRKLKFAHQEASDLKVELASARSRLKAAQEDAVTTKESADALMLQLRITREQVVATRARLSRSTCYATVWAALAIAGAAVATVAVKSRGCEGSNYKR